ncbi:uncharacterized protein BX663DRAFT_88556 [Cokeromyces recurvatus]|uniref:uncharacterized protein n=1 Tax=Cokeromyces recurvatus TaxID=90255 RepID=UPI00221EE702|nr:uncharacterized protein BX663DRAFT_88556 [Cokeromyces recurvatus]KAI7901786.1 hypothetical protein BX663DRAFT_88556 [Cokeromyces recurvatus]
MQSAPTYHAPNYPSATTTATVNTSSPTMNVSTLLPIQTSANNNDVSMTSFGQQNSIITNKRTQVKNACTNCQRACKKCDDARPCPRCIKYGIAGTCVSSVRKERKKGIKRGPYKKRQKSNDSLSPSTNATSSMDQEASTDNASHVFTTTFPSQLSQYTQAAAAAYDSYSTYACVLPIFSAIYPHQEVVNALQNAANSNGSSSTSSNSSNSSNDNNKSKKIEISDTTNVNDSHQNSSLAEVSDSYLPPSEDTNQKENNDDDDDDNTKFDRLTELCSAALQVKMNHSGTSHASEIVNQEESTTTTTTTNELSLNK